MVSFKSYNINKYRNKLIDKQRNRKYINVYLDSLREFYNLTNNEKNVLLYINSIYIIKLKLILLLIVYFIMIVKIKLKFQYLL